MNKNFARRIAFAAAAFGFLSCGSNANAQLVRVGPLGGVSVRLPFVSVDTLPLGGGASVRAPFTSVDTGLYSRGYGGLRYGGVGYRGYGYGIDSYGSPHVGIPIYPDWPLAYPSYRSPLSSSLYGSSLYESSVGGYSSYRSPRLNAYELDRLELDRVDRYARLQALADTERERVYRSARPSLDLAMEAAIEESLTQPPVDLAAEEALRLRQSASRLQQSLFQRSDDANVWLNYLEPGLIVDVIDGVADQDSLPRLEALYLNYEGVAGNADLTGIWSADGFRQTHQGLRNYLDTVQGIVEVPGPPSIVVPDPSAGSLPGPFAEPAPSTFPEPATYPQPEPESFEMLPPPKEATL